MVFKPQLEHNMSMSNKNGDGLQLPFFFSLMLKVKESIRLERD